MSNAMCGRASGFSLILPMWMVASVSGAAIIQVPGDHNTIQDAVDAAASGDRIEVSSVTSEEDVQVVDKNIDIVAVATPIVVGSFSWTNPGGAMFPGGGLVEGFDVTGDVTAAGMELSFTANELTVEGKIAISAESSQAPFSFSVIQCMAQQGIFVAGLYDENGGGVSVTDCRTSDSIVASGLAPSVDNCELTGSGDITCDGSDRALVNGCRVDDGRIDVFGRDFEAIATNNVVVGGNILVSSSEQARAADNVVHEGGIEAATGDLLCLRNACFDGAFGIDAGSSTIFTFIEENLVVRCGIGIYGGDKTIFRLNTIVDCAAQGIASLDVLDEIEQNIVVGCAIGIELGDGHVAECNDVWDNAQNWVGAPDPTGTDGNISIDPLFCDPNADDYTLATASSCLPGNHPDGVDCGTIGAFGEGCSGPVPVVESSWGSVKSLFRR